MTDTGWSREWKVVGPMALGFGLVAENLAAEASPQSLPDGSLITSGSTISCGYRFARWASRW